MEYFVAAARVLLEALQRERVVQLAAIGAVSFFLGYVAGVEHGRFRARARRPPPGVELDEGEE